MYLGPCLKDRSHRQQGQVCFCQASVTGRTAGKGELQGQSLRLGISKSSSMLLTRTGSLSLNTISQSSRMSENG